MRRRILGIFVSLVMMLTVFAVAVTGYTLNTVDSGIAEHSSEEYLSGPYSVKMTTTTTSDVSEIVFDGGPQLSEINALSYWTYTEQSIFGDFYGGILRPKVGIYLHTQPGKTLEEWKTDISSGSPDVYLIWAEPFYTNPTALELETWEKWDAYDMSYPLLWMSLESPDYPFWAPALDDYITGAAVSYPTPFWGDQSFASREYGSLYIVAISIKAGEGGSWPDFIGYVDDVIINEDQMDFSPIAVSVDIRPGSSKNPVNLKSRGKVPVAILTTDDFDAAEVDPDTVELAGAKPLRWRMADVDDDGDMDMLFHFKTQHLELDSTSTEAALSGKTLGGIPLEGSDSVNIVPKKK